MKQIDLAEVNEALNGLDWDPPLMRGSAKFAQGGTLRRELRRWWVKNPQRWAAWLMLNPSVAAKEKNDPTALRVTHFSKAAGCDGWIGVNLYPFVASKPEQMWHWANWEAHGPAWDVRDALAENLTDIEEAARASVLRVVAFGAAPIYHDDVWLEQCLEAFGQPADRADADEQFYCLGVNSSGQPLHPLARGKMRIAGDVRLMPWSRDGSQQGPLDAVAKG